MGLRNVNGTNSFNLDSSSNAGFQHIEFIKSVYGDNIMLIQDVGFIINILFLFYIFFQKKITQTDAEKQKNNLSLSYLGMLASFGLSIYFTYSWGFDRILFAFGLSLILVFTLKDQIFGLCAFLCFLFYRPWELYPDPIILAIPKYFGLYVVAIFSLNKFRKNEFFVVWNFESTALIIFSFWTFLSLFKTSNLTYYFEFYQAQFTKLIIIYFLITNVIKNKFDLDAIKGTLMITIFVKGIVSYYNTLMLVPTHDNPTLGTRLVGLGALGDPNDLSAILIIGLPLLCSSFFNQKRNIFLKIFGSILVSFFIYLIWYARSRGALIALLFLFLVYLWQKTKSRNAKMMIILMVVGAFFIGTNTFKRSESDLKESGSNRLNYWVTGLRMAAKNPIIGVGYNSYPENFTKYSHEFLGEWGKRTAHSTWILILAETGPIGLFLFLILFVRIFKKAIKNKPKSPELFYSLAGYTVTMTFLSHAYVIYPYILFSLISAEGRVNEST